MQLSFDIILMLHVSCLCPWARQNFPALRKIEQTLSHRLENTVIVLCGFIADISA